MRYQTWVKFSSLFHMSGASGLFNTYEQMQSKGAIFENGIFFYNGVEYLPMYEGKMIWLYNHHFGIWPLEGVRPNVIDTTPWDNLADPSNCLIPWYWIDKLSIEQRFIKVNSEGEKIWEWSHDWMIGYRDITNATNERTFVSTILPRTAANDKCHIIYPDGTFNGCVLQSMFASMIFDYISKQKLGGSSMSYFYAKQLPVLTPEQIPSNMMMPIVSRVAQLCYFNHDLDGWAEELWDEMNEEQRAELPQLGNKEPFIYDPENRAKLQAELDAIFAHLYGLTTEELRYILDPEDVCGEGCINETFRVLKDNEIRQYGEYRTKRLVMKAWYDFCYDN